MVKLSRRKLLAAAPLMTPLAVAAIATSMDAPAAAHPDADLFRLQAEFDQAHARWLEASTQADEAHKVFHETMRSRPAEAADFDAIMRVRRETGWEGRAEIAAEAAQLCDRLSEQVRALPAHTLDGLLVKLRVTAFNLSLSREITVPPEEMDWDAECFLALIHEVERMAGASGGAYV